MNPKIGLPHAKDYITIPNVALVFIPPYSPELNPIGRLWEDIKDKIIVEYFVLRWDVEVTFQESRRHLGVETQRQWTDKAVARSTPALMSLFSIVCLRTSDG